MQTDQELIHGRVAELGAFEGGDRLKATLVPEDEGPPIRLDLKNPPAELASAIVLGARVGCRAYHRTSARGPVRIAFWIESVERREGRDQWDSVWKAPKPFVPRRREEEPPARPPRVVTEERVAGGAVRRRRSVGDGDGDARAVEGSGARPRAPIDTDEGELVTGVLRRLERLPNMRTVGTVLPDDGGPIVELRLRRAPRGLLAALGSGARVHCLAAPHMSDPSLRFSARVVSVDLKDGDGNYQEAWRHDPERERRFGRRHFDDRGDGDAGRYANGEARHYANGDGDARYPHHHRGDGARRGPRADAHDAPPMAALSHREP